jgi:hypothetical protein
MQGDTPDKKQQCKSKGTDTSGIAVMRAAAGVLSAAAAATALVAVCDLCDFSSL